MELFSWRMELYSTKKNYFVSFFLLKNMISNAIKDDDVLWLGYDI